MVHVSGGWGAIQMVDSEQQSFSFYLSFQMIDGENGASFLSLSVRTLIPFPFTDKHGSNGAQVSAKNINKRGI